jgi:hypothetical protein
MILKLLSIETLLKSIMNNLKLFFSFLISFLFVSFSFSFSNNLYDNIFLGLNIDKINSQGSSYNITSFINGNISIFDEIVVPLESGQESKIISMNIYPNIPVVAEVISLNIEFDMPITLWMLRSEQVSLNLTYYSNKILYASFVFYQPFLGTISIDCYYADIGQEFIYEETITFDLFVKGLGNNILSRKNNFSQSNELHASQTNIKVMDFALNAQFFEQYLESIVLVVTPDLDIFSNIKLLDAENNLLGQRLMPVNDNIHITLDSSILLELNVTDNFSIICDLKNDVSENVLFNVNVATINSFLMINSSNHLFSTSDIISNTFIIVTKNKPIINSVAIKDYLAVTNNFIANIEYVLTQGDINAVFYRAYCINDFSFSAWITKNIFTPISSPLELMIELDSYFEHNKNYLLEMKLQATEQSELVSSNVFLVDLTSPNTPTAVTIKSYDLSRGSQQNTFEIEFEVNIAQSLDVESGIQSFQLLKRDQTDVNWQVIVSEAVVSQIFEVTYNQTIGTLAEYSLVAINGSGLESEMSDIVFFEDGQALQHFETLFNNPNPFDSRVEDTTIYYTLKFEADVDIYIYDMYGYLVNKWSFTAGSLGGQKRNQFVWDGRNILGDKVSKGGYILIIFAKDENGKTVSSKYKIGVIR